MPDAPLGPLRGHDRRPDRHAVRRRPRAASASSRSSAHKQRQAFEFMNSAVSTEKPKGVAIRQIAQELLRTKPPGRQDAARRRAGDRPHGQRRARLPADSRGLHQSRSSPATPWRRTTSSRPCSAPAWACASISGDLAEAGPRAPPAGDQPHPPRSAAFAQAVESGRAHQSGIMYECVRNDVDFLLAGSIRDDGPLPEVITDTLDAQRQMREQIRDVTFCLMIATTLHSHRRRQPAAGLGQGRLRRYQSLDRHQARRPRLVPDRRPGDRRRALLALAELERSSCSRPRHEERTEPTFMTEPPHILMCPPDYYGIEYEINPWMNRRTAGRPRAGDGAMESAARTDRRSRRGSRRALLRSKGCPTWCLRPTRR